MMVRMATKKNCTFWYFLNMSSLKQTHCDESSRNQEVWFKAKMEGGQGGGKAALQQWDPTKASRGIWWCFYFPLWRQTCSRATPSLKINTTHRGVYFAVNIHEGQKKKRQHEIINTQNVPCQALTFLLIHIYCSPGSYSDLEERLQVQKKIKKIIQFSPCKYKFIPSSQNVFCYKVE